MSSIMKRKAAMVLHQIEESLGNFVLNNGNIGDLNTDAIENIHNREVTKGKAFSVNSIKNVIESTYLGELFGFAQDIAKDTSLADSISYLYSLFHHLDIYEVRNAISHPNKPFWDCFWYRVATIASDPVNDILGFDSVKKVLASAESNMITDPPEEWIHKIIWQIPNNLPKQFEHGVTGLIGRNKETLELKKLISNLRINTIALVAPGGIGKTALALDLLDGVVSTPSYSKYVDAVIYLTMKTEKLTTSGVVSLDSIETITELKKHVTISINNIFDENHETFEQSVNSHQADNILLCLDNLETLLRDESNYFDDLNSSLPSTWKVLVTSRVIVSNANIMTVEALAERSATHLARNYLSKKGNIELKDGALAELAKNCHYNPLAIRLTLDLIVIGKDMPSSLSIANKEIAEFSYNNLIAAMSKCSIDVLEAIFVEDESTRVSLCEILDLSLDEVSTAIRELNKTSLITRTTSELGESYRLNASVRELLLVSPKNIEARANVQTTIRKRTILSAEIDIRQDHDKTPSWHHAYIPKDTNENLKILIRDINKNTERAHKNAETAINLFKKLKESQTIYDGSALYHRAFARVLEALKDTNGAEEHYKRAIALDEREVGAQYLLARLYHERQEFDKSITMYQGLLDHGWTKDAPEITRFGRQIYTGLFLSYLYLHKFEDVLRMTKKWKDSGSHRGILGTYRASAWQRSIELLIQSDHQKTVESLVKATRILSDVFRNDGYFTSANREAKRIIRTIEMCFTREDYCDRFKEEGLELLVFIAENVVEICQQDTEYDSAKLIERLSFIEVTDNPFKSPRWRVYFSTEGHDDGAIPNIPYNDNLIEVRISNIPKNNKPFMFARDYFGEGYFLHRDNLIDGSWDDWSKLAVGSRLSLVGGIRNDATKAIPAKEIYLID